jgi:GT2 family glycosyltransferase/glycosyltransferase involved in cell wall biosynthesis
MTTSLQAVTGKSVGDERSMASVVPIKPAPPHRLALDFDAAHAILNAYVPDQDFELLIDGRLLTVGGTHMKRITANRVNRLLSTDETPWQPDSVEAAVKVGKNTAPGWTFKGHDTYYIASAAGSGELPVTVSYSCPIEGLSISVLQGEAYTFEGHFAAHRCTGAVRLTFKSAFGEPIKSHSLAIVTAAQGGRSIEGYQHSHITVRAPAGAASLTLQLVKDVTEKGEKDSFLFLTQPLLTRTAAPVGFDNIDHDIIPDYAVAMFKGVETAAQLCQFPVPDAALDGEQHLITIRHRPTGDTASLDLVIPAGAVFDTKVLGLEGSALVAQVISPRPLAVSLWVDGQWTAEAETQPSANIIRFGLPPACCDGRPHLFELRRSLSGKLLAQYAAIGPVSVTPWDALEKYARMPLPAHLAPLAALRYKSLADAGHAALDRAHLVALHDILLEGFSTPRREFRALDFPAVDSPDVSIVIPVHDKFDVTYVCLAAILFAASKATYEVIVVDDGSADTTLKLPEIAPGVVYVRNDAALGFVGACNAGAARARGRYIYFLNNDTEPTAYYLDELIFAFENFDNVGLAGSKLIYADGVLQEAGGIVWGTGDPWNYGRRANAADPRFTYSRICDYVSGAAIMIPRALWQEVGGFSQEFMPAYFEDTDLAFKVAAAGKKVVYAPQSVVVHYEGMSNGTDQTASGGLKRFQEINRPKFKRKWAARFAANGKLGDQPDLAKDRGINKRVLFIDHEVPHLDRDAGSYAAIQEIRMFQALGCKVTFAPMNMAYLGRHSEFLQRIGVETVCLPFITSIAALLEQRGREFDLVYITRYGVAAQVVDSLAKHAPQAKIVVNVADLHFLRQLRDAAAEGNQEKVAGALKTREAELAALSHAELILSYSAVEQAVISSHITHGPKADIVPWVIDPRPLRKTFAERRDVAFLGGFSHYPNIGAVRFFIGEVMPLLRRAVPGIRFIVYGSNLPEDLEKEASDDVVFKGYVSDVAEVFDNCRIFVAPLLSGAGMKGKVLDCIAAGVPSVLSPIAAEGIGLSDGVDTVVARTATEWAEGIARIYDDEAAWSAMSANIHDLARRNYSFERGVTVLHEALASIDFYTQPGQALFVTSARPDAPRHLPERQPGPTVAALKPGKPSRDG